MKRALLVVFVAGILAHTLQGQTNPPLQRYTADANTLFLFHFDETAGGSVATNLGSAGGCAYSVNMASGSTTPPLVTSVLGGPSYTNFGNAATFGSGQLLGWDANQSGAYNGDNGSTLSADQLTMASLNMGNGGQTPWTLEAMICPRITNANQEIISTDSSASTRGFQFRLNTSGQLELNLIAAGINPKAAIPSTGPHAFVPNTWYHVAATYDGANIVLYWTKMDPLFSAANPIYTNAAAVGPSFGAAQGPLIIGNENRSAAGEYFQGLIDEVRISNVARATNGMLFRDNSAIVIVSQPTAQTFYPGDTLNLSVSATGASPLSYQWRRNGTPIANATNSAYTIATAQMSDAGSYDVVITNALNAIISMAATVSAIDLSGPSLTANPDGMLCELLEHPEETVITAAKPRFGWSYKPSFRNDSQTAYRIIVASSQALAEAGTGDWWDSGLVSSSMSLNVPYGGAPLQPNTNYFWRVQTVNSLGQSAPFSAAQQFNTAAQLADPLASSGVIYQMPQNNSANCYPLRYVAVAPVLVTNVGPGHWFVDFGKDAFGYATMRLTGNFAGTNVAALLGEMASGYTVNSSPGGTVRCRTTSVTLQNGTITYPLRAIDTVGGISPPAIYGIVSPFRYLEVNNCPAPLSVSNVTQLRLQTEFNDTTACFASSSPALNQVWELCKYSMKALTFDGIYVDGDRERTPYEADAYIQQMSSYGVEREFTLPRCSFEYLTTHPTWPTEWSFHMVFVAWADYLQTGNTDLLFKYYKTLTNDCLLSHARADGLITGGGSNDLVDWPSSDRDGYDMNPTIKAVINAFYYRCLLIMTQVAQLTGHDADAANFSARASQVYSSFDTVFWNATSQSYIDGEGSTHASAHANFFPLAFGLVPANKQAAVVNYLHARTAAKGSMVPSVYGAQYLLEALFQAGDADTALGLITTNSSRSWLNMLNIGSTITDEAWSLSDKSNEDWNHAWGAAPGNLIPRYVLGLRPLTAGYGQVLIQPQLGRTLSYLQGTIPTIRGPVSIQVTNGQNAYQMLLNLPGNMSATVMLPTQGAASPVALVDGQVVSGSVSNSWLTLPNLGSGQHAVWLSVSNTPATSLLYSNWATSWFGTNASIYALVSQGADPDGDGMSNWSEFIAGTDPTDANSRLMVIPASSGSNGAAFTVTVSGQAGRSYILQRSLTLPVQLWESVATNGVLAASQSVVLADPQQPAGQAYYRVLVSLGPVQ